MSVWPVARSEYPNAGRNRDHRRASAFRTRISAAVSTSDHTRIRSPSVSTISISRLNSVSDCSAAISDAIVTVGVGAAASSSADWIRTAGAELCRRLGDEVDQAAW